MLSKNQIRKNCIEKRKNLGQEYIDKQSQIIMRKILNTTDYKNAECIFTYVSTHGEVNTKTLMQNSHADNKTLMVPILVSKCEMAAGIVYKDTIYIKNRYNIDEPYEKIFFEDKIDIIISPGLCFDEYGNRLGYGGGYFDRFFQKHKDAIKIGVCLDEFMTYLLPCENYDVKMDRIITQSRIINL